MNAQIPAFSPTFKFVRQHDIDSLGIQLQEFVHEKTGASHIHLHADNEENVFLVALRTVPHDSTGVAHILEHTALCGSKHYPVRDPFFMMTRRSLNTFMNAFTSSDWTAYPFASFNKKDFNNLLSVYLDAVFFSNLDPFDFAQEGHRLEFQEYNNPATPLEYKGVVYNEMKGAMSSISSQLWHTLMKYVFPSTTYHYNSGGDPADIPDLSYEQLQNFYRTHYHPSNAIFMTYGNIPAVEHQQNFESKALYAFDKLDREISVPDEKRFYAPVRVKEYYPNNESDISRKHHVVMGWLLGSSTNLRDSLRAQLLSSLLLDNSASPLMHALESSELGDAPSPLCGLDDSQKELCFVCGLADCADKSDDDVEALILDTLKTTAEQGIPSADVEAALHQLELHQREISGDSYPYGLQLILKSLTSATHRGDPVSLLDLENSLKSLREEIHHPDFIQQLIKELLLDNFHRVRLTLSPDDKLAERRVQAEKDKLAKIKASLSEAEIADIVRMASVLKDRQNSTSDDSMLPKVDLDDVPSEERIVSGTELREGQIPISYYRAGTNGLCYEQVIFKLHSLDLDDMLDLSLYSSCATELGAGDKSYLEMQKWQAALTGGVSNFSSIRGAVDNTDLVSGYYIYSAKALNRNRRGMNDILAEIIRHPRFDEQSRIAELLSQIRNSMEQGVTSNGHVLAMTAACAGICATAKISHNTAGLQGLLDIKKLDSDVSSGKAMEKLCRRFDELHRKITSGDCQILYVGDEELHPADLSALTTLNSNKHQGTLELPHNASIVREAWIANTQVNFCAKAYPTVALAHEDAAPLVVLGNFLRNGFLHKAIREQGGAYGGGASQDNNNACFRFYSYRDPRLADTLNDFDAAIAWFIENRHSDSKLEEAIFGAIGALDRSESPAGQAKRCFHSDLHGRTVELRKQYRQRVLNCRIDDLKRVAERYFSQEKENIAVLCNSNQRQVVEDLGLQIITV